MLTDELGTYLLDLTTTSQVPTYFWPIRYPSSIELSRMQGPVPLHMRNLRPRCLRPAQAAAAHGLCGVEAKGIRRLAI